jgi:hypothetical protein
MEKMTALWVLLQQNQEH